MSKKFEDRCKKFLWTWLGSTTCRQHIKVDTAIVWHSAPFVLFKHHGHTSYINRFAGTTRCCTSYFLYDLDAVQADYYGFDAVRVWEGRWTNRRQKELEEFVSHRISGKK